MFYLFVSRLSINRLYFLEGNCIDFLHQVLPNLRVQSNARVLRRARPLPVNACAERAVARMRVSAFTFELSIHAFHA